jgi:hypothetical protein
MVAAGEGHARRAVESWTITGLTDETASASSTTASTRWFTGRDIGLAAPATRVPD